MNNQKLETRFMVFGNLFAAYIGCISVLTRGVNRCVR
jgi:hypothetical protein